MEQTTISECAEHPFHDVPAMPDPIPGAVCLISTVVCNTIEDFNISRIKQHIVHDVLAMPSPIPGTVCLISIVVCVILLIYIFYFKG